MKEKPAPTVVTYLGLPEVTGTVIRKARDGSWIDIRWVQNTGYSWSKRQPLPDHRLIFTGDHA
jgi:hypothetical protein